MSTPLPTEILETILDFLQSDIAALKTCSRSHPILGQLVEKYLYSNITIHDEIHSDNDHLDDVLRERPHLVKYVCGLEIKFGHGHDPEGFLEQVSLILPTLSMLRRIGFTYTKHPTYLSRSATGLFPTPTFSWKIPQKFRLAFADCLRLPSMTDVCVENFPFPLSMLTDGQHIRNVSLRGWCLDGEVVHTSCLPAIDSLTLYNCRPDSLSTITSWIQSHRLSSLEYHPATTSWTLTESFCRILIHVVHSLTSLVIDIGRGYHKYYNFDKPITIGYTNDAIPIPLPVLKNLRQLTIHARLDYINRKEKSAGSRGFWSPIPAIRGVLKSASSLRSLTLSFYSCVCITFDRRHQNRFVDVFCTPLRSLLLQSASSINFVNLQVNFTQVPDPLSVAPDVILSLLANYSHSMQSVENSTLILTAAGVADAPTTSTEPQHEAPLPNTSSLSSKGRTSSNILRKWSKKLFSPSTSKQ